MSPTHALLKSSKRTDAGPDAQQHHVVGNLGTATTQHRAYVSWSTKDYSRMFGVPLKVKAKII